MSESGFCPGYHAHVIYSLILQTNLRYRVAIPRIARLVIPGVPHHITHRGNNHALIFRDDQDRKLYLELLQTHAQHRSLNLFGYCLMPNHIHLIGVPADESSLALTIQHAHRRYAQISNERYSLSMHLWQGRFFSCPMDETHLVTAMRYIERNPVRAGLVEHAWEYPWSSAIQHIGLQRCSGLIAIKAWQKRFSPDEWQRALERTDDDRQLLRIRQRTLSGIPLGEDTFVRTILAKINNK